VSYGEPIALRGQMELEQVAPAALDDSRPAAEEQFIERLRRGDAAAFEQLVNERSGEIYGLLYRLTENSEEARDLTQETFLRAFQSIGHFRGDADLRTWIYRIAINHCRNLQQAWHERHMFTNADDALWETTPAQTDSPLRVLETKELGQRIQKSLDGLPAEYRLLLLLVADEQLSYEQVGALTDQSADAVRGKLHRARKAFAVLFAKTA